MASIHFLYKFYNDHKQEIDDYISGNDVKESFQQQPSLNPGEIPSGVLPNSNPGNNTTQDTNSAEDVMNQAMGNMDKNAKKLTGGMIALFISIAIISLGLYIWAIIALVANKKYMQTDKGAVNGAWIASLVLLILTGPVIPLIIIYASRKMPPKGSTISA
jgi:hypothetical protein